MYISPAANSYKLWETIVKKKDVVVKKTETTYCLPFDQN